MGPRERLRRREADWIARRIRNLLDVGRRRSSGTRTRSEVARAVQPGDIALLFRA